MKLLDSGKRRKFDTGAVRDIQEGKGRCDLLPLDVVAECFDGLYDDVTARRILRHIDGFQKDMNTDCLLCALWNFIEYDPFHEESAVGTTLPTVILEVSKQFEEGAEKYGENNWRLGLPVHCYIDSAVRHFMKYLRGDRDEPHARAFVWNILCCIWTVKNNTKEV